MYTHLREVQRVSGGGDYPQHSANLRGPGAIFPSVLYQQLFHYHHTRCNQDLEISKASRCINELEYNAESGSGSKSIVNCIDSERLRPGPEGRSRGSLSGFLRYVQAIKL